MNRETEKSVCIECKDRYTAVDKQPCKGCLHSDFIKGSKNSFQKESTDKGKSPDAESK